MRFSSTLLQAQSEPEPPEESHQVLETAEDAAAEVEAESEDSDGTPIAEAPADFAREEDSAVAAEEELRR